MCVVRRYNKYIKNLVKDMHRPEINLSRNFGVDAACNYDSLVSGVSLTNDYHNCVLSSMNVRDHVCVKDFEDLLVIGCPTRDPDDLSVYRIAKIMDKLSVTTTIHVQNLSLKERTHFRITSSIYYHVCC